jgi:hypothetical protein
MIAVIRPLIREPPNNDLNGRIIAFLNNLFSKYSFSSLTSGPKYRLLTRQFIRGSRIWVRKVLPFLLRSGFQMTWFSIF